MKKLLAILVCVFLFGMMLAGCGQQSSSMTDATTTAANTSSSSTASTSGKTYKIGMVANNIGVDDYQTKCDDVLRTYAKAQGNIDLTVLDAAGDQNKQISMIEDLIQQKPDLIIVWACDSKGIVPGLEKAYNAGIKIMCTNNPIDASGDQYLTAFVGPDHYDEAKQAAKMMEELFPNGANIVQITGLPGYDVATWRQDGFEENVAANIKILETQNGDWNREKAQQQMENMIQKYGDKIEAVYVADDNMAVGAFNALSAADMKIPIIIAAFIGNQEGVDYFKDGTISGGVLQSPFADSQTVIDVALKICKGEQFEKKTGFPLYPCKSDDVEQVIKNAGFEVWE